MEETTPTPNEITNEITNEVTSDITYESVKSWLEKNCHKTITAKNYPEDFKKMIAILKLHPNYDTWAKKDCEAFKITRSPKNKAIQVEIKMGGKWRIVSWVACAKGKVVRKNTDENKNTSAMRFAIRKQIKIWRHSLGNSFNPECNLCKCKSNLEVDHFPQKFSNIRDIFLASNEIDQNDIYWDSKKASYRFKSKCSSNTKWQRFHAKHATYRWLCGTCNKKCNNKNNQVDI